MDRASRLYVSDLDGTLLGDDASLSDRTRSGLVRLLEEGMMFTVASARSVVAMQSILAGLDLPLPVIEFNGAFISDLVTGRHLVTHELGADNAVAAYEIILAAGCLPFVSSFDGVSDRLYYSVVRNPGMTWYVEDRRASGDRRLCQTPDLFSKLSEQVVCLTVVDRPDVVTSLRAELVGALDGALSVTVFPNLYVDDSSWLTVHDTRATKDQALRSLQAMCGLRDAEVVAFGDSENDIPLFRCADRAIAVANASAEIRSLATGVIGPNSEDSVVRFLERERRPESSCGSSTTIRRMVADDELDVSALLCDCYRWLVPVEGYSRQQMEFLLEQRGSLTTVRLESRDQLYLVACRGEGVVGMVAVAGHEVTKLYVSPGLHRQGIGTTLLEAAAAHIRDAGFDRMALGTTPTMVEFYEGRGMRVAGRKLHTSGVFSGRETVLMEVELAGFGEHRQGG